MTQDLCPCIWCAAERGETDSTTVSCRKVAWSIGEQPVGEYPEIGFGKGGPW